MAWVRYKNLILVISLAALVRLVYLLSYLASPLHGFLNADQIYYYNWGLRISRGDWPGNGVFEQGPLYAYLLGLAFVDGLPDSAILFLQMCTGVGVCALVYLCGRRLFDERAAVLAGIITAAYGPLVYYECMMMKSFLSPFFTMLVLYGGLRYADAQKAGWLCLMGAAAGLACLLNESHVLLLLAAGVATWCMAASLSLRKRLAHLGMLLLMFVLMLMPSAVRNLAVAGEFVLVTTGGGEVMYIAYGPNADGYWNHGPFNFKPNWQEHRDYRDEAEHRAGRKMSPGQASRFWYGEALAEIAKNPLRTIGLFGVKTLILFNDHEVPDSSNYAVYREFIPVLYFLPTFGWVFGLGVIGIAALRAAAKQRASFLLALGLIAAHVLTVILTYNFGRFRIGMMPVWNLFAAFGLVWLITAWRQRRWQARLAAGFLVAATVASFWPMTKIDLEGFRQLVIRKWDVRQAIARLHESLATHPDDPQTHSLLAQELHKAGYIDDCLMHHRKAVELAPSHATLRLRFAIDLLALGYEKQAVEEAFEAMRLDARGAAAEANTFLVELLWHPIPARRQAASAVELGERICATTEWQNPRMMDTLAAAYAEVGRFDIAATTAGRAAKLAEAAGDRNLAQSIREMQQLYRQGKTVSRLR